jgi:hypothetical protein
MKLLALLVERLAAHAELRHRESDSDGVPMAVSLTQRSSETATHRISPDAASPTHPSISSAPQSGAVSTQQAPSTAVRGKRQFRPRAVEGRS